MAIMACKKMLKHDIYLELIIFSLTWICSYGLVDYTENIELIQQRVGYDLKLKCDLKGLVDDDKLQDIKIHWFFKQCGESSVNLNSCHDSYDGDWSELPCENSFCKPDLFLRNVTERYSGLYKCTVYPYGRSSKSEHVLDIQLVRTYQLDVRNTTMAVPEFLDNYPLNKSAVVGAQVVFQCRVHSEVHPTIKWFRRIPESRNVGFENFGHDNFSSHIVRYNGHTYELLSTAHEKFISDETYLSKLLINGVRWQDEGYYACVAVNYQGHRIRLFYLAVFASAEETEYWTDYDASEERVPTDPREFWLLFLMPLCLAMLPISVWLSYRIYKKCTGKSELKRQRLQHSDEQMSPDLRRILTTEVHIFYLRVCINVANQMEPLEPFD